MKDGGRVALTSTGNTSFDFTEITDINSVFSVLRPTNFTGDSDSFILGDISNYNYHSGGSNNSGKWLHDSYSAPVVRNGDNYLNGTSVNLTTLMRSAGQYVLSMIHTANTAVASTISQDRTIAGRSWIGNRQELIIYSDDRTNQRASIEENIGDYFTQNTPLLDTYTGAAAAYSLRKLSSSYSGSAIRVRRSSDNTEQDINFNVFGELDTVSLLAFAGQSLGVFVKVWYDQSSNGVDVTQTNTGKQPQIVSSGTVIVEANGKPAIKFDGSNDVLTNANGWTQGSSRNDFNVLSSDGTAAGVWNTDFTPRFAHNLRCDSMKFGTLSFTSSNVVVAVSEPNASTINTSYLVTGEYDLTNTALSLYKNGSLEVTTSMVNQRTGTGGDVSIGTSYQSTSGYFGGKIQEIVSYQTRKADDRADIESNINLFYNIY